MSRRSLGYSIMAGGIVLAALSLVIYLEGVPGSDAERFVGRDMLLALSSIDAGVVVAVAILRTPIALKTYGAVSAATLVVLFTLNAGLSLSYTFAASVASAAFALTGLALGGLVIAAEPLE